MVTKTILGPDGNPIARRDLTQEVAAPQLAGVRAMWDESVASGLAPQRLANILREVVRGDLHMYLKLAEELEERDAHYGSVLGTRKRAVSGIIPVVDAASTKVVPAKVVDAVTRLLEDPTLPDLTEALMDGIAKGFSMVEIMWGEQDGMFWPTQYLWRDPSFFTFDLASRTQIRLAKLGEIEGVELPRGKFIAHVPQLKSGIPIRGGVARTVAWLYMFKHFSLKDWVGFLDIYGMPIRVGKYHPSATSDEKRALMRAVAGIAADAAAIIPDSMMIEFIEAKANGDAPYEAMAHYCDEQISRIVLGQTLTSQHGGSGGLALGKIHNEVRLDIRTSDARQLGKTINRDLIAWFVSLNFGVGVPVPRVVYPTPKAEDIAVLSTALGTLVPLGLEVAQDDVREKLGIATPTAGAKLLKATTGSGDPPPMNAGTEKLIRQAVNSVLHHKEGCACGCQQLALNRQHTPDLLDTLAEDASADWEPLVAPMVKQVQALAARCTTYEEFMDGLNELQGSLDTDALQTSLAHATVKARGLGLTTDEIDG